MKRTIDSVLHSFRWISFLSPNPMVLSWNLDLCMAAGLNWGKTMRDWKNGGRDKISPDNTAFWKGVYKQKQHKLYTRHPRKQTKAESYWEFIELYFIYRVLNMGMAQEGLEKRGARMKKSIEGRNGILFSTAKCIDPSTREKLSMTKVGDRARSLAWCQDHQKPVWEAWEENNAALWHSTGHPLGCTCGCPQR